MCAVLVLLTQLFATVVFMKSNSVTCKLCLDTKGMSALARGPGFNRFAFNPRQPGFVVRTRFR